MLALVVLLATIDLGRIILRDMLTPPVILLEVEELLELFGACLLVMIGLELLNTIKIYITEKTVHVEVVLTVGIIAIARIDGQRGERSGKRDLGTIVDSRYNRRGSSARQGDVIISGSGSDTGRGRWC